MELATLLAVYFGCCAVAHFGYEPLRNHGLFDIIAQETIFQAIPLKRVRDYWGELTNRGVPGTGPYQPITRKKETRLLILEPGEPDDPLRGRLVNVELSWRTRYEALSYAWGDDSVTTTLECAGHKFNITPNLRDALIDLRYSDFERVLWVDAVCIDQTDNVEKQHQIRLMGSIYAEARRVLIYLGKAEDSVSQAMAQIRKLDLKFIPLSTLRYSSRHEAYGPLVYGLIESFSGRLPKMAPIPDGSVDWDQVISLLQRPWFQRTWTKQEAILAKRAVVFCGTQSVSWFALERVVNGMDLYAAEVGVIPGFETVLHTMKGIKMVRAARRERYRHLLDGTAFLSYHDILPKPRKEYSELLDLIIESRQFQCSRPQDKIFGVLGVAQQDTSSWLLAANPSIPVSEGFRNFVVWEIFVNKSLRVLGCSSNRDARSPQALPSWVPNFADLDRQPGLLRLQHRVAFNAGGDTSIQARLSRDEKVLYLRGRAVDMIHTVGDNLNDTDDVLYLSERADDQFKGAKPDMNRYLVLQSRGVLVTEAIRIWNAACQRLGSSRGPLAAKSQEARAPDHITEGKVYPANWDSFWRTLICDCNDLGRPAPESFAPSVLTYINLVTEITSLGEAFVKRWMKEAKLAETYGSVDSESETTFASKSLKEAQMAERSVSLASKSRRFAGTDQGLAGWVPKGARKGDVVAVMYGSRVPFILRMAEDGKYRLVGECYIHGLMAGEAITAPEMEGNETEFALV
ncbi:hypothetical protein jhhlp_005125 [Lomentospora prolificans]|uniref:Heterokaryon incompatibility domain-containing protein n=1 Tax=Lomentospora prolificans TaxID=41688 RepID=A0A2N3N7N9_9PEZI|nr:hypothetical protein jhhlp_005125 [Lomentospora prolificans]